MLDKGRGRAEGRRTLRGTEVYARERRRPVEHDVHGLRGGVRHPVHAIYIKKGKVWTSSYLS